MASLIVFDLDGTLIDSRRDITDAANELLVSRGAEPLAEERIGAMVGEGAAVLVARACAAAGLGEPAGALEQYLEIYARRLLNHTRPYPGVREALAALGARAGLAVLTNKPRAASWSILEGLDLARHFDRDAVVGGDGPWARKPDPAGLCRLASRAEVDVRSAVLVGDSLIDWRTAHAAGARACMARYGFGFASFPADRLGPDDLAVDRAIDLVDVL
jgi:phosphoglycolate phosphatase